MPTTDFPFGYNLSVPEVRENTVDDVFYGMSGPCPEVVGMQMAYSRITNECLAALKMPWYKVKRNHAR